MFSDQFYTSNRVLFVDIFFSIFWPFIYSTMNKQCLETWSCVCGYCICSLFFVPLAHSKIFLTRPIFEKVFFMAEQTRTCLTENSKENSEHAPAIFAFWNFFRTRSILHSRVLGERQGIGALQERALCWFFCKVTSVRYCSSLLDMVYKLLYIVSIHLHEGLAKSILLLTISSPTTDLTGNQHVRNYSVQIRYEVMPFFKLKFWIFMYNKNLKVLDKGLHWPSLRGVHWNHHQH